MTDVSRHTKMGKHLINAETLQKTWILILKKQIEGKFKILWTEILQQVDNDELIYKLTLKFLRRDGYDIGNNEIPEVKKFLN